MARTTHTIEHRCGHTSRQKVTHANASERDRKVAALGRETLCPECAAIYATPTYRAWTHPGTGAIRYYVANLATITATFNSLSKAYVDEAGELHTVNLTEDETAAVVAAVARKPPELTGATPAKPVPATMSGLIQAVLTGDRASLDAMTPPTPAPKRAPVAQAVYRPVEPAIDHCRHGVSYDVDCATCDEDQ